MLRRRIARRSLIAFTEYCDPRYKTGAHHRVVADHLERVARGEIDRLGLELPPRHGKSRLASQEFVAWFLGQYPDKQIISVSASGDLAADFGREVRNRVASREYRHLFPGTVLAEDSQAKGRWHTDKGGIYYAVGIGGSVLGKGAHIAIVDDPFGSMADAMSEVERANVINWYRGTLYNRLMPGGAIILIGHRMHEDDLAGHLLQQQGKGGDQWTVVKMPAVSPKGEALWPESYPLAALNRIKANTLPRDWSALYMQNPVPDDGTFFKREWFKDRYVVPPDLSQCRIYGGSDYATREGKGDWTAHVMVAVDPADNIYVIDVRRMQETTDVWVDTLIDLMQSRAPNLPMGWAEPRDTINNSIGPFLNKRMMERRCYVARTQYTEAGQGKKDVRARSFQGRCAMGKVKLPAYAPWLADFEAELFAFPNGKHDDQVDACAMIGRHLDAMISGHIPQPPDERRPTDYSSARDDDAESWRTA